ncbi:MAG: Putative selenium metabolism hydrolase [Thermotogales bacterium 46_20]|nr:MAG: Putative selenium metabolism hydrolase [Thermotogales bacterium 46_20]
MRPKHLLKAAWQHEQEIVAFLRDIVMIPSYSGNEEKVVKRIALEMEKVGFDEVKIDPLGNVIGRIGSGPRVIAMDAHIDTVELGNERLWKVDPFGAVLKDGIIYGRGASDQKAGMASLVYGAKIMKELVGTDGFTLYVTGTVMEEDCDGLCWKYIIDNNEIRPDYVVISEPTNLNVYRGHRGRLELQIRTEGRSCHASAPERGVNAIYKMVPVIQGISLLNDRLKSDDFLGKGSVAVTQVFFKSPSQNAVPDECTIQIDRRLTAGETKETVRQELEDIFTSSKTKAEIVSLVYEEPAYTGVVFPMEKYFPTWVLDEDHPLVRKAVESYREVLESEPDLGKWGFSTNGTVTAGLYGIPTVGFGPGNEIHAHSPDDQVSVEHLVKAAAVYALMPAKITE